jgi:hypothetical protein
MLPIAILDVSCVSHTCCKCMFQMFHLFSDVRCIQMFFMLQVFYVVRPGVSRGRADLACNALGGWWTRAMGPADGGVVVLWSGRACPQLLIRAPECRPRKERGGGQERPVGAETRAKCTRGEGRRQTRRATPVSRRVRPSERPGASYAVLDLHVLL